MAQLGGMDIAPPKTSGGLKHQRHLAHKSDAVPVEAMQDLDGKFGRQ